MEHMNGLITSTKKLHVWTSMLVSDGSTNNCQKNVTMYASNALKLI